jgi:hypothetical protein
MRKKRRNILTRKLRRADKWFAQLDKSVQRWFASLGYDVTILFKDKKRYAIVGIVGLLLLSLGVGTGSLLATKALMEIRIDSRAVGASFQSSNISLSPCKVRLENVPAGSQVEQYIYISNKGDKDIELSVFKSSEQAVALQWVSFESDRITVRANSKAVLHIYIDVPWNCKGQTMEFLAGVKGEGSFVTAAVCSKFFLKVD